MVDFNGLDDDVLRYLFEFILHAEGSSSRLALAPLSSTCIWLLCSSSKPFIFHRIHRTIGMAPPTPEFFLRPSLWSYVQRVSHSCPFKAQRN